jgi:hypothetical protein
MGARNPTSLNRTPKIGLGYLYLREENQLHYLRNVNYLHVNINFEQVQKVLDYLAFQSFDLEHT